MGGVRRAVRPLLLAALAVVVLEYLIALVLDSSSLWLYFYTYPDNASLTTFRIKTISSVPGSKQLSTASRIKRTIISSTDHKVTKLASYPSQNTAQSVTSHNVHNHEPDKYAGRKNSPLSVATESNVMKASDAQLPLCPKMPSGLGPIEADKTRVKLEVVERRFPGVRRGGRYAPPNCTARHRVAIIVPYRNREQHLAIFLNHMHPFLMKQMIDYGIFIIEQQGDGDFNRAKLMNVGFAESQRLRAGGWRCFVFHDIDLLPLDTRNLYSCPRQPRHMSASVDTLDFKLPYPEIFGGVSAMTLEQFERVNGFSNKYWGWGGEDDDMFYRLEIMKYHIARYKMSIARYTMTHHKEANPNPRRYDILSQMGKMYLIDGLSTLQYEVVKVTQHHLYTHVLANIDERS